MANPTSGFQLSKLPEPLSIPTNIGVVDVGQMQKAYANAMQNVQDTALFGQRVAAQKAALDYQEQLARQQSRLLSPQEQALVAGYRADQLAKENAAIASGAQRPYVAPTTEAAAAGGLATAQTGQIAAEAERGLAVPVGQSKALSSLYGAEADRAIQQKRLEGGGVALQRVPLGGGIELPVVVGPGGGVTQLGGTIAGQMLSRGVTGEYTTTTSVFSDATGKQFAERVRYQIHPNGSRSVLAKTVVAFSPDLKDEFVQYPTGQGFMGAQPAPQAAPQRPLATFGGETIAAPDTRLMPGGPVSALAAPAPAPASAPAAPVDTRIQPSPFLPTPGAAAPAAAPSKPETVVLPWLQNREVTADSPLAKTQMEFDKLQTSKAPQAQLKGDVAKDFTEYQREATLAAQTLQTKTDALNRLKIASEKIQRDGIGTGAWQKYVPADLLQLMGDASKQNFVSAVNELVNKLSEDTKFRNFAVVDLIRSTKPETSDDPSVVTSKIDYLAKGLSRWQDAALAANEGLSRGLPPNQVRQVITRNFNNVPYEKFARQNPSAPMSREAVSTVETSSVPVTGPVMSFEQWRAAKAKSKQ